MVIVTNWEIKMLKHCVTSRDSSTSMNLSLLKYLNFSSEPHLYLFLRNNIYYVRYELERVNGKRRFRRLSLHTDNFHIARQMLMDISKYKENLHQLDELCNQLVLEKKYVEEKKDNSTEIKCVYELGKDNDINLLKQIKSLFDQCFNPDLYQDYEFSENVKTDLIKRRNSMEQNEEFHKNPNYNKQIENFDNLLNMWKNYNFNLKYTKRIIDKVFPIIDQIQKILSTQNPSYCQNQALPLQNVPTTKFTKIPHHTIQEVIDKMEEDLQGRVNDYGFKRKTQDIAKILSKIGLSFSDDYNKINDRDMINKIESIILRLPEVRAKTKNRYIRCFNTLTKSANKLTSYYEPLSIELRPENTLEEKAKEEEYLPFKNSELIEIFNPEYDFFKKHPDTFYACLIAMYCGGRTNGVNTLKYTDIIDIDGIKCFDFKQDDKIKHLKNAITMRIVPIHSRLIELGFLDYIEKHREKNELSFKNCIFASSLSTDKKTKEKKYNDHIARDFHDHLRRLGIKKDRWKAFYSFRNTISNAFDDAEVREHYVDRIIGWSNNTTRSKHYRYRYLPDIQKELEKLQYPFLDDSLNEIAKQIMETT